MSIAWCMSIEWCMFIEWCMSIEWCKFDSRRFTAVVCMILTKEIAGFSGECSNFKRFSLIKYELDIYIYNFEN